MFSLLSDIYGDTKLLQEPLASSLEMNSSHDVFTCDDDITP